MIILAVVAVSVLLRVFVGERAVARLARDCVRIVDQLGEDAAVAVAVRLDDAPGVVQASYSLIRASGLPVGRVENPDVGEAGDIFLRNFCLGAYRQ
jgi:hypothetical protein